MRIIFAGTSEFAAVSLKALYDAGHQITLGLTKPDRPSGRGMHLCISPVKEFALKHRIPFLQPESLKIEGAHSDIAKAAHTIIRSTPHDVMIVAAYGLIIPASILDIPKYGCLNIHGSLLPRWRGAAPIQRAIEAGDNETGITIMQMDEGLDTGDILLARKVSIDSKETASTLHDKLANLGSLMIVEVISELGFNALEVVPQPLRNITYANKVIKKEAALDFRLPADVLERKIRAFNPFPGAFAMFSGEILKIWASETSLILGSGKTPGTIIRTSLRDGITVACGESSALRLLTLQRPSRERMSAFEFLKSSSMQDGHFNVIS